MSARFLRGAVTADGARLDVLVDGSTGVISQVRLPAAPVDAPVDDGTPVDDLDGYVLLAAPVEPHAHLDKALLADRSPNRTGDLAGAIEAMTAVTGSMDHEDLVTRARAAALTALAHGTTAIRTHADVTPDTGVRHVEALVEVRESLRDLMTIQVVALTSRGRPGDAARPPSVRDLVAAALDSGADIAGGCPHLDEDPAGCLADVLDVAHARGVPVDLHTDENTDPASRDLAALARAVRDRGFGHGVTAGHCVSLGIQSSAEARATAAAVAAAGISVVALPQTNLYLQGRDAPVATPRGLTAIRILLEAGATVAGGGDNVRDPFNPVGRGDALETASLLVTAGHLLPDEAYRAVSAAARVAMGLAPVALVAGSPADLVAVRAASLTEAIATGNADRRVYSRGRLVATTRVERTYPQGTGGFHGNATAAPRAGNTSWSRYGHSTRARTPGGRR